jgi:GR25 family glycosyltransferase involved in LPS biosynthesis
MLKIFIISLKRDEKKRREIENKLNSLGLGFSFVDAIDGKHLTEAEISHLNFAGKIKQRAFNPTLGEIGCGLSHLIAYRQFLTTADEWACILEDDVILDERFSSFIKNFNENELSGYQDCLFILGGQDGLDSRRLISKSLFKYIRVAGEVFRKIVGGERHVYRACCYLVSRKLSDNLLSVAKESFFLADDWLYLKQKHAFQQIFISDFVAHPIDLSNSTLEPERQALQSKVFAEAPQLLKTIKYFIKVVVAKVRSCFL